MKKHFFLGLIFIFSITTSGFAWINFEPTTVPVKTERVSEDELLKALTVDQILNLTPRSYKLLTGKKMSLKDRISLHFLQKQLKKDLKKDGKADAGKYIGGAGFEFNLLGFLIGLILGILGIIGVYIFSRDRDLRKSAWIGFAVWVVIFLLIL